MLTYFIQMIACSGVFYAYYHFFLRNERFHQYNRFYLLSAMVLSLVLPLIEIPVDLSPDTNASSIIYAFAGTGENVTVVSTGNSSYVHLIYIIYAIPVVILVTRFILSVRQIVRIRKHSLIEAFDTVELMNTDHPNAPFSFFNWLFWNNSTDKQSAEGRHMLQHELYHIRSKHSWDLVFIEIVITACWLNPFFYIYRKEIKTIQEFLADRHASTNSDTSVYAELLLLKAIGVRNQRLVNPFFHNQIKRRILMLTSSKKPAYQKLRKFTAILLLLLTAATAIISWNTSVDQKTDRTKPTVSSDDNFKTDFQTLAKDYPTTILQVANPSSDESHKATTPQAINAPSEEHYRTTIPQAVNPSSDETPLLSPQKLKKESANTPEVFTRVDIDAKYPGNWRSFLERSLDGQVAVDNGAGPGTYTIIIKFIVDSEGNVSDIEGLTNVGYGMEQEAIRVIQQSGKWSPAVVDGQPVKAYRKQPITFQVTDV